MINERRENTSSGYVVSCGKQAGIWKGSTNCHGRFENRGAILNNLASVTTAALLAESGDADGMGYCPLRDCCNSLQLSQAFARPSVVERRSKHRVM